MESHEGVPQQVVGWGERAVEHYLERMGAADDLGIDTAPGSRAESIARREALWVSALPPSQWPGTAPGSVVGAALNIFCRPMGAGPDAPIYVPEIWPIGTWNDGMSSPSSSKEAPSQ